MLPSQSTMVPFFLCPAMVTILLPQHKHILDCLIQAAACSLRHATCHLSDNAKAFSLVYIA